MSSPTNSGEIAWSGEIHSGSSKWIRVHFSNIVDHSNGAYEVALTNIDNHIDQRIPSAEFSKSGERWSNYIWGSYALVQIRATGNKGADGLTFSIDSYAYQRDGGKVLSLVADALEPAFNYYDVAGVKSAARSVARLTFIRNDATWVCSGFLVGVNTLITNQHCLSTTADCNSALALFGYEYGVDPSNKSVTLAHGEQFGCVAVAPASNGLDLSAVTLEGTPGDDAHWGHLTIATSATPGPNPPTAPALWIIEYPQGQPKQISRVQCVVSTNSAPPSLGGHQIAFGHTCDTMNGSSGSPVLNSELKVVGVHFLGFVKDDPIWSRQNRAINLEALSGFVGLAR
jgi:V8-like Glu-specific endopeptidase